MGGFLFTTKMEGIQSALDVFSKKGLAVKDEIIGKDFRLFLYEKVNLKTENIIKYSQGDFIVSVGTLIYKDLMGAGALSKLYNDFNTENEMPDKIENEILGQYCVILRKHGRTYFFNDLAGSYKIFINNNNTEGTIIASSFLAILAMLNKKTLAKQETYEFIFTGASYGGKTLCHEVSLLDGTSLLIFNDKGELDSRERSINFQLYRKNSDTIQTNVNNMISNLRAYFKVIKNHFDGKIIADLTGGYDTRLIHCLLKDQDIKHASRVAALEGGNIDVQYAREIAVGEHIDLIIHDYKDVIKDYKFNKELFLEAYYGLDGIGYEIIPTGLQICKRFKEMSGRFEMLLTGAGGENFRAYGGWSQNKPISIKKFLLRLFPVNPIYCCDFDIDEYYENLKVKIKASLQINRNYLCPHETEILYQIFRMRYWGGRYTHVTNQFLYSLSPFKDPKNAFPAFTVPTKYREKDLFERRMIEELDGKLANYPSEHDNHSSQGALIRWKNNLDNFLVMNTPEKIKNMYRKYKAKGIDVGELPSYLQADFLRPIFGKQDYAISKYIDIDKCNNPLVLSRCYTLELLLRESGLD